MSLARKTLPNRRQPLKRVAIKASDKPLARAKPMAKRNAKRRKQDAEVNDLAEFAREFIRPTSVPWYDEEYQSEKHCWLCRDQWATAIHHAAGRNSPLRHHRASLFATCQRCHDEILPGMSLRAQFILKEMRDPSGFDKQIASQLVAAKNGGRL